MRATMGPEMTDQLLTTTVLERGRKKTLNEVTNSLHKPFSHFFFVVKFRPEFLTGAVSIGSIGCQLKASKWMHLIYLFCRVAVLKEI